VAEGPTLVVTGAALITVPSVAAPVGDLELRIDAAGITQLGGEPQSAWQIPWAACRDVRTARSGTVVLLALSLGALRYRWEIPEGGIPGGAPALLDLLQAVADARPMARGLRGARRRR
jgi:hypothetical protein